MNHRDIKYMKRIVEHIKRIILYTENITDLNHFEKEMMILDASMFNLLQIGEISKDNLSESSKRNVTAINWNEIYGFRNRIVHNYDEVDMSIVYQVIKDDLPKLLKNLIKEI